MTLWFFHDPARLEKKRAAIAALDEKASWLKGPLWTLLRGNLAVQADIEVEGVDFPVVLEYPALFPASPPTMSPRESNERWSDHQYPVSGELCLEWGPDNWEPHITGADLLESAYKLLSTEKGGGDGQQRVVASRHKTSLGQDLRGSYLRVAINPECDEFIAGLTEGTTGTFEYWAVYRDGNTTIHIQSVHPDGLESWKAPELPKALFHTRGFSHKGRFARTGLTHDSFREASCDGVRTALARCGCESALVPPAGDSGLSILLLWNNSPDVCALMLPAEEGKHVSRLPTFKIGGADVRRTGGSSPFFAVNSISG